MSVSITPTSANVTCNGLNNGQITLSVSGGVAPYSYVWTKNGTFYSNDQNIYFLGAGTYIVVVTDSTPTTPLTATATVTITQPSIVLPNLDVTADVVCSGQNGTIEAFPSGGTSPYTYLWNTAATTASISVPTGNYAVVVTDANGCKGEASIFLPDEPPVIVEIEQTLQQCYNGAITLTANVRGGNGGGGNGYTVLWSTGETTFSIQAVTSTLYSVTATDLNSCTGTTQIYVPTQLEAWQCCLGKQYAAQAQTWIQGNQVSDQTNINTALLAMAIDATTRFGRTCLTAQQQQIILDYINQTCSCECGNIAQQQQL